MRVFSGIVPGVLFAVVGAMSTVSSAQSYVEENVVYGMHFGTALLMDVYHPETPNGYGVVVIAGSGWHAPDSFEALPLKEGRAVRAWSAALQDAGYTAFTINHRAAPGFRYPDAIDDAQRAVRYIRQNADAFGVDPSRLGAMGHSSGGYLANMLGVLDGDAGTVDRSTTGQQSSKVQAVVALATAADSIAFAAESPAGAGVLASFLGTMLDSDTASQSYQLYQQSSPRTYVSPDDPPFLLIHGDADLVVPLEQSVLFAQSLRDAGVIVELILAEEAAHNFRLPPDGVTRFDFMTPAISWFDRHLRP